MTCRARSTEVSVTSHNSAKQVLNIYIVQNLQKYLNIHTKCILYIYVIIICKTEPRDVAKNFENF